MTNFTPKSICQRLHPAEMEELQKHREDGWLVIAFSFALSEMAFNGANESEINGAKRLIYTVQNLWEKEREQAKLPEKRLTTMDKTTEQLVAMAKEQNERKSAK